MENQYIRKVIFARDDFADVERVPDIRKVIFAQDDFADVGRVPGIRKVIFAGDHDTNAEERGHPFKKAKYSSWAKRKQQNRKNRRPIKKRKSGHTKFHPSFGKADFEEDTRICDDLSQSFKEVAASSNTTYYTVGAEDLPGSAEWFNHTAIGTYVREDPRNKMKVIGFSASIDKTGPTVFENPRYLKYNAPAFRASATIQMAPMARKERWKVGFIQAITDAVSEMTLGDEGCLAWKFPELESGILMVNDSVGHHYPWVGPNQETVTFEGPCNAYQSATIKMADALSATTAWRYPYLRSNGEPNLTNIFRDQSFNVWLVALNMSSNEAYVLKTVQWNTRLNMDVDSTKPLGFRTTLRRDQVQRQPWEMKEVPIPRSALLPPCANTAHMLVWRPKNGKSICLVPPEWTKSEPAEQRIDINPCTL